MLQSCNGAMVQCWNVAMLQSCNVAMLQYCTKTIALTTQHYKQQCEPLFETWLQTYVRTDRWASWAAVAPKKYYTDPCTHSCIWGIHVYMLVLSRIHTCFCPLCTCERMDRSEILLEVHYYLINFSSKVHKDLSFRSGDISKITLMFSI